MCHHVIVIYHFNIQFYRYILVDISWVYFLTLIIIFIYGEGNTEYLFIFYFYFFVISSTFDRERKSVRLLLFWRIWIVGKLLNLKHVAIARNAELSEFESQFLAQKRIKVVHCCLITAMCHSSLILNLVTQDGIFARNLRHRFIYHCAPVPARHHSCQIHFFLY